MRVRATESEMISRRRVTLLVILSCLSMPLPADAQQVKRVYRVGVLETISPVLNAANFDAFRHGLRALGYIEGQNLVIEYRSADGDASRFPALAIELVRLQVDVLVTRGTPAALAAKNAAGSIPVVMAAIGEPLGLGIVANLARPGGNVTGLSAFATELSGKRVELLREMLPRIKRIAALLNMGNPLFPPQWKEIETAARSLGIKPQLLDVRKSEEIGRLFGAAIISRADALVVGPDAVTQANLQTITGLATKHRLPTMYPSKRVRRRRRTDLLRSELSSPVLPRVGLRRQDLSGGEAWGPAGRAADEVRVDHQSQGRKADWINHSTEPAGAGGQGHQMTFWIYDFGFWISGRSRV